MRFLVLLFFPFVSITSFADDISVLADPWCPYTCDAGAANKGVLIELMTKAMPQHKIIYKNEGWARSMELVKEGKENAVAGAGDSDAKDFVAATPGEVPMSNCFFVLKGSTWKFTDIESLKSITLGVINGYNYETKLDAYIASKPKGVDIYSGNENGAAINVKKLVAKRIDAYIDDKNVVAYEAKMANVADKIQMVGCASDDTGHIAFSKKNPKSVTYLQEYTAGVKKLRDSGEYQKILEKYGVK